MKKKGFTLVEVLVALAIGTPVIALVLSSFLALATSAASVVHYRDMHKGARNAMAVIGRDIVTASEVTAWTTNSLIMDLKTESGTSSVTYNKNEDNEIKNDKGLVLATGVTSVSFNLYKEDGKTVADINSEAYYVEVILEMERKGVRKTYTDELQGWYRMRNRDLTNF